MNKILELSETGFRTEQGWASVDKFKCPKNIFKDLKIGDMIDSIKLNPKGYVTDFIVLTHGDSVFEEGGCPPNSNVNSVTSPSPILRDRIMYGQCVNLGFRYVEDIKFKNDSEHINSAFDIADEIYTEYARRLR